MEPRDAAEGIKGYIRSIPNFPKSGVNFRDITPLLKDKEGFRICIKEMARKVEGRRIDYVVGIEARGFIPGAALAYELGVGFIPARKKGKLPRRSISKDYALEYGTATLEMHHDSVESGKNVLIVDDLLATGGTARAVGELVRELGGNIVAFLFVIELIGLNGRKKLGNNEVISLVEYTETE